MINYVVNPKGIASEYFQDETIILNLPKGNYYSLRGTGQLIWTELEKGVSTSHILEVLSNHYDTTSELATLSLKAFLHQLVQEELVTETYSTDIRSTSPAIPASPRHPFVAPVLEVYTDMQELLMLDPIHEADPEKGWPYKNNA